MLTLGLTLVAPLSAPTSEKIVVDGSTGVIPLVAALARAYQDRYPAAVVEMGKGLGTKARLQALERGPDLATAPRTRPDSEVDAEVVRENIACLKDLKMPDGVRVMPKSGDMATELGATVGAVGMTTTTVVGQSQGRIRAMSLNGISPSAANVGRKIYTLTRDSFLVTKATPSPAVSRFVEFVRSSAGAAVIVANGALPLK